MLLVYNEETQRYNNLHCGECFKIKLENEWKTVRIEIDRNGWYLIDENSNRINCKDVEGIEIEEL